jgi:D-3-phosphoglycerate dehydrogenase
MSLCLIIDDMHPSLLPMLRSIGIEGDYQPKLTAADVPAALAARPYQGLMVRSKMRITASLLAHGPQLRYVARAGAGVDNIDVAALAAAGVVLVNAPEGNRDAVGEFALGQLLALLRHTVRADAEVRRAEWHREANRGEELGTKTVGIVGYGHMGRAFARRLSGFGCPVLAYDNDPGVLTDGYAELVPLAELQARAEVLSLHFPYSEANHQFVNEAFLSSFAHRLYFVNTARGEVVDQAALVARLQSGAVRGAVLDVLDNEKLATLTPAQQATFDYLRTSPHVLLSPHIGGWTHQSYQRINEVLVAKIAALL